MVAAGAVWVRWVVVGPGPRSRRPGSRRGRVAHCSSRRQVARTAPAPRAVPRLIQLSSLLPGPPKGLPQVGVPLVGVPPRSPPPNLSSNRRLQQTQAQVKEVVDIMCVNVDKVLERDQKLSELDDRADALQAGASQFESSAAKLKRKYWWKNCKMMIMMGVICAIVVVVIVSKYQNAQDQR
ncbi:vesicle-associated membrane protein 1 [Falco cherrug]|uniref:vesicle-associated membrane protein 1 n=1 Tax=Falco cherrug TaxID=345164 RepID=UPI00247A9430|nr:vesicle-associated membrane protein 1 [Falco cherrug]